ncbi:MAG TPA: hypothetical protein V6C88_04560 [Chroococcidiopsis sp.]
MMKPKFANTSAWQQAELLMQPVFIRLLDNIRKQLDESTWKWSYQNVTLWGDDVPTAVKEQVAELQAQLKTATPQEAIAINATLDELPQPSPGYQLCLQQGGHEITVDLWQLCYQICFRNYSPPFVLSSDGIVEIDTSLIDETGEVDWQTIETKTQRLVRQLFENLPRDDAQ